MKNFPGAVIPDPQAGREDGEGKEVKSLRAPVFIQD